ncbi:hypothetical protein DTO002I6_9947 [Penicillium roqueforti]|nr:hypothetical protein DTO002I6_9947 [Penicillium roqueforti]
MDPFDEVYNRVTDYLRIPAIPKRTSEGHTFQAAFPHGRSARRRISYDVRDDLEWWKDSLSLFNGVLLIDPCRRSITHLYTDASNTGQGLFFFSSKSISDCWLALAQDAHAHINTTEIDAILQGFLLFSRRWLHHTLVIHTDSSKAFTGLRSLGIEPPAWFSSRAPQLNAGHLKLLWSGLSANTRSVYHSVQRNYEKHCRQARYRTRRPSRPRAYHIDNFLENKLFDNKHFRRLIDGARRLNPITKVRVRKPISRDTITKLSAGLATLPSRSLEMTANLLDDLNFATACRVAFAGFLRLGEFTYKTEDLGTRPTFLAAKLTRSDVRFSSSLDHVQLTLKRSKTDRRHEGAQIILAKTGDGACPVDALQRLLLLDPKASDAPLFSFHRRPFNRNNFLSTLSTKLRALGIHADGYSGHSFRKGVAQHAHDSGILDDQIQVLGRWTSEAFRVYFTTNTSALYKLNHQFQTGSPAPLSLLLPPPSPPPS